MNFKNSMVLALVLGVFMAGLTGCGKQAEKPVELPTYRLAVSIYTGWMPWYQANENGVLAAWATKHNCKIEIKYMSYGDSLDAFVAGKVDAVVMTNMEAMDMPAAAGVDTTVVVVGDYSNGNDAVLARYGTTLNDLAGKEVTLCEKSVSEYLLARAMALRTKVNYNQVKTKNVSDTELAALFTANQSQQATVTWNPMKMQLLNNKSIVSLFDSSEIPGEIQDLLVVNTAVLKAHPEFVRALTGTWYETMGTMRGTGPERASAIARMAAQSGCTPAEFEQQLTTTALFYTPVEALNFTRSAELKNKNDLVRKFCAERGLMGNGVTSADVIGIQYPDGSVQGDPRNIKLRYVTEFMEEAAAGKLSRN